MKQNVIILATALAAPALWIGCSNDDDDGDTPAATEPQLTEASTAT